MGKTKQRQLILDFINRSRDHATAGEVWEAVRQDSPSISVGTVYRNLTLLAQQGDIRRLHFAEQPVRFDQNHTPHEHMVCESCGRVVDVALRSFTLPEAFYKTGARVTSYSLQVFCLCESCKD